jgi:N6-adenosine-specific RNA methylase IME4
MNLPTGPFDVILADPPWQYANRVARKPHKRTKFGGGVSTQYPTMAVDDICAMPVKGVAAPSALLFLWTTWPHLESGLRVMNAWGFDYVTIGLIWVKTYPSGELFFGPGYYAKSNTEPCLLGRRGRSMKPAVDTVSSVIVSPVREHSRKPEAARHRIQQMYPTARKVELFARESSDGWEVFGNQVDAVPFAKQERLFVEVQP